MDSFVTIARALAMAFMLGDFDARSLVRGGERVLGRRPRWLLPLCVRIAARFPAGTHPTQDQVVQFVLDDRRFQINTSRNDYEVVAWPRGTPPFHPLPAAAWRVPELVTVSQLAEWLGVSEAKLEWFADLRGLEAKSPAQRLRHYRYRVLIKGQGRVRLIEAPKPRLKEMQRAILAGILDRIPPHGAAHGFRAGRSIRSFAAPHVGSYVVLKIDLEDFFPSIRAERVRRLFRTIGYPEGVAALLTGLCTNICPAEIWGEHLSMTPPPTAMSIRGLYARPHLPQGAPTSPALANLCAYRLDCRLTGLATSVGARYTRYADDLAFSGEEAFEPMAHRFQNHVHAAILDEGFRPNFRKTRTMRRGVRQHVAGLVVNERLNIRRADFDILKATLTNCLRYGPASQNRDALGNFRAHLAGRVAFVASIHPERGRRLREMLDRIEW